MARPGGFLPTLGASLLTVRKANILGPHPTWSKPQPMPAEQRRGALRLVASAFPRVPKRHRLTIQMIVAR
jgi:hypothetical protein